MIRHGSRRKCYSSRGVANCDQVPRFLTMVQHSSADQVRGVLQLSSSSFQRQSRRGSKLGPIMSLLRFVSCGSLVDVLLHS